MAQLSAGFDPTLAGLDQAPPSAKDEAARQIIRRWLPDAPTWPGNGATCVTVRGMLILFYIDCRRNAQEKHKATSARAASGARPTRRHMPLIALTAAHLPHIRQRNSAKLGRCGQILAQCRRISSEIQPKLVEIGLKAASESRSGSTYRGHLLVQRIEPQCCAQWGRLYHSQTDTALAVLDLTGDERSRAPDPLWASNPNQQASRSARATAPGTNQRNLAKLWICSHTEAERRLWGSRPSLSPGPRQ